ncbi:hypothetical protein EDB81DRAFT_814325 [Dactylonectria macrodidyma]|uniref:Secreted protein n=1 Tax=Dactylonectria macrodidyma TaxID=307937 RepID=A0A9P9DK88_9HYPO|nr:hypothetical protein EDB81DRAFT_814325 [Dactylonectria macrodidyma]
MFPFWSVNNAVVLFSMCCACRCNHQPTVSGRNRRSDLARIREVGAKSLEACSVFLSCQTLKPMTYISNQLTNSLLPACKNLPVIRHR